MVRSDDAVVIVNELPAIVTQPLGTTICEGQGINLTYQWFLNGNAIAGAVSSTYSDVAVPLAVYLEFIIKTQT